VAATPGTHTFTGVVASSSEMNSYVRDPLLFLFSKPAAELRQSVAQSIPNATWTSITFDAEDLDSDPGGTGGHSTSVNTSRYVAVYAGWYRVGGGVEFAVNATGQRGCACAVNGTLVTASRTFVSATAAVGMDVPTRTKLVFLNIGDYVELQAYQNSTAALNTFVTGEAASSMSVVWERN